MSKDNYVDAVEALENLEDLLALHQYEVIRQSSVTNMFDVDSVRYVAKYAGFSYLAKWCHDEEVYTELLDMVSNSSKNAEARAREIGVALGVQSSAKEIYMKIVEIGAGECLKDESIG